MKQKQMNMQHKQMECLETKMQPTYFYNANNWNAL